MKTIDTVRNEVEAAEQDILSILKSVSDKTGLRIVGLSFFDKDGSGKRKEPQVRIDARI